jgi:CDP-6-deoxy-D-xylo-4-hexulose-3-dehydrase
LSAAIHAVVDFWLTAGPIASEFERRLSLELSRRHSVLVNSGSSANLLALTALTDKTLGDKKINIGDEVITLAAGFPTTVAPILQNNLVPVYVDVDLKTYAPSIENIEAAISPKTRAIMLAHTLGNPADLDGIRELCTKYNLWFIEDSCDSLGGLYKGKKLGGFGDISTFSFYPAHHITTGEGGAVVTDRPLLKKIIESLRDWGRDCWCLPGCDNTCAKRFEWSLGNLPDGYDHKYIYSRLGYNLKSGDVQAAIGIEQLKRLNFFTETRIRNWQYLHKNLAPLEEFFHLPQATENSSPSWFGFALTLRPESPVSRNFIVKELENYKIGTRLLFGGNLLKQPAFNNSNYRISQNLNSTNIVMENTFWLGVYPQIDQIRLDYVIDVLHKIMKQQ